MLKLIGYEELLKETTEEERLEYYYSVFYPNSMKYAEDGCVNRSDISLQKDRLEYRKQFEGKHFTSFGELVRLEELELKSNCKRKVIKR